MRKRSWLLVKAKLPARQPVSAALDPASRQGERAAEHKITCDLWQVPLLAGADDRVELVQLFAVDVEPVEGALGRVHHGCLAQRVVALQHLRGLELHGRGQREGRILVARGDRIILAELGLEAGHV